jgi:hypothetical protein
MRRILFWARSIGCYYLFLSYLFFICFSYFVEVLDCTFSLWRKATKTSILLDFDDAPPKSFQYPKSYSLSDMNTSSIHNSVALSDLVPMCERVDCIASILSIGLVSPLFRISPHIGKLWDCLSLRHLPICKLKVCYFQWESTTSTTHSIRKLFS